MGIYSFKLEAAADVADVIQTPGDVGNDLDQIEKAVLDSHDEEVEDAAEGLIGDPVDEATMIMFESEYNYNQILSAIGMHELREASFGRDVVYEAVDIKGFFAKVKEILKKMFQRITEVVHKVIAALDVQAKLDNKYVKDHKADIEKGFTKDWKASGYVFAETGESYDSQIKKVQNRLADAMTEVRSTISKLQDGSIDSKTRKNIAEAADKKFSKKTVLEYYGADSIKDITKNTRIALFGSDKPVENLNGKIKVADIINLLTSERETTQIKAAYSKLKEDYKKALKALADIERDLSASKEDYTLAMTVAQNVASTIKFSKEVDNACIGVMLSAARAKRNQARRLAHAFVGAAKKDGKKKEDTKATNESGSIFGGITLA